MPDSHAPHRAAPPPRKHALPATVALACALSACAPLPSVQAEEERVRAELAEQARQAARPSTLCAAPQGSPFALRKKVAVLALPVQRPLEAADLPGISTAWSRALQQRLQGTNQMLVRDGSAYQVDPAANARQQITALAQQFNAQFVIAGRIESIGVRRGRIDLGLLRPIPQPSADQRTVVTTLDVYDGQSGARIKQLNHTAEVRGAVDNRSPGTLQGDFFDTPLGTALATLLDRQGEDVADELACLPMQARITRIQSNEAHLDAGFSSNLAPGDRLRIYQRKEAGMNAHGEANWTEERYGEIVIRQVFPESSVGRIESAPPPDLRFHTYGRAW